MNILLFFPGGLFFALAMQKDLKWWKRLLVTILLLMFFSFSIEACQYHFHLGTFETDDIFHNTLGALIGFYTASIVCFGAKVIQKNFIFFQIDIEI